MGVRIHWKASRKRPDDLKKTMGALLAPRNNGRQGSRERPAHPPRRFLVPMLLPAQRSRSKTATLKKQGARQWCRHLDSGGSPVQRTGRCVNRPDTFMRACCAPPSSKCSGSDNASQGRAASLHRQLYFFVLSNTLHDLHSIINWLGRICNNYINCYRRCTAYGNKRAMQKIHGYHH
jgi:hypothetical protein